MDQLLEIKAPTTETKPLDAPDLTEEDGPLPADPKVLIQAILLFIALMSISYLAADIVVPIVLAFLLNLLLQPGMRLLEKIRIPRAIGAVVLILGFFGIMIAVVAAMSGPAASWAHKLPGGVTRLQERLMFLNEPIHTVQTFLHQLDAIGQTGAAVNAGPSMAESLFKGTQHFASGFFETLLILFFLLISGDTFLRRTVEIVPSFKNKRRVVALSQQVEENISAYLVTITLMNGAVGIATGVAMWACGLADPLLWGCVAFFLNFVQILGPLAGIGIFFFAGQITMENGLQACVPAILYLLIHMIEGEAITPMLLARRFTLNPVLVIISLIFWFWMWGALGAVLAVPLLGIAKIICDGLKPLNPIGHFLAG